MLLSHESSIFQLEFLAEADASARAALKRATEANDLQSQAPKLAEDVTGW